DLKATKELKGSKELKGLKVTKDLKDDKGLKVTKDLKVLKDLKDHKGCFKAKLTYPGRNDLYLQQISSANINWLPRASLGSFFYL
ncbi:hypothetical protein, partial [Paenibacillus apiarius]